MVAEMQHLGRYEILGQLGQGTMGIVYKARDPLMDREVAIKTILGQSEEFRERFFLEARAAGRLHHPGIVTIFDVSEHDGIPFLVMEYVPGSTLLSILQNGERMSLERVFDIGIQLGEALDYAHRNGVIHRDIKPANILVTSEGRTKIADFGIAKLIESQITAAGKLLGTPAFMAPEQFTGMPIDRRSDVFSVGVVIYFLATGEKPFTGDTVLGVQYRVMHTDPVQPKKLNPAISQDLESVILKCIDKDPARRFQSCDELVRNLRACVVGTPVGTNAADRTVVLSAKTPAAEPAAVKASRRRMSVALLVSIPFLITFFAFTIFSLVKKPTESMKIAAVPATATEVPIVQAPPVLVETPTVIPEKPVVRSKAVANEKPAVIDRRYSKREIAPSLVVPPPPVVAAVDDRRIAEPLPLVEEKKEPVKPPPSPADVPLPYNPSRLLIGSIAVPEPLTIIVTVDNEPLFTRTATKQPSFGMESFDGRVRLDAVPTVPMSEERLIPPGKHKVRVNVLMETRRIAKVQEVSDRFYPGQRRVLQIEFLPESQGSGHDSTLFKLTLR